MKATRVLGVLAAMLAVESCSAWPDPERPDSMDAAVVTILLDAAQTSNSAVWIGPGGGHFDFGGGLTLDVPEGALTAEVQITAKLLNAPPSNSAIDPADFRGGAELGPEGTQFLLPVTVTFPVPPGTAASVVGVVVPSAENAPADAGAEDALDSDDDALEPGELVAITPQGSASVSAQTLHFCALVAADPRPSPGTTLGELSSCSFATPQTSGLSQQIFDEMMRNSAGVVPLVPVPVGGQLSPPAQFGFLNPAALQALQLAAATTRINIGYVWRSLAAQFVINRTCGKNKGSVAAVGASAHGAGAAIDISMNKTTANAACAAYLAAHENASAHELMLAAISGTTLGMASNVGDQLADHNFIWWGYYQPDRCNDSVHFEYRDKSSYARLVDVAAVNTAQVRAFERLWNYNYPCEQLKPAELGKNGALPTDSPTYDKLSHAPAGGFLRTSADDTSTIEFLRYEDPRVCSDGGRCCPANAWAGNPQPWCDARTTGSDVSTCAKNCFLNSQDSVSFSCVALGASCSDAGRCTEECPSPSTAPTASCPLFPAACFWEYQKVYSKDSPTYPGCIAQDDQTKTALTIAFTGVDTNNGFEVSCRLTTVTDHKQPSYSFSKIVPAYTDANLDGTCEPVLDGPEAFFLCGHNDDLGELNSCATVDSAGQVALDFDGNGWSGHFSVYLDCGNSGLQSGTVTGAFTNAAPCPTQQ